VLDFLLGLLVPLVSPCPPVVTGQMSGKNRRGWTVHYGDMGLWFGFLGEAWISGRSDNGWATENDGEKVGGD